jgi:hypothetical protein
VHINTTALSGASVNINNCFTSTYRNYLIVWRVTLSGANNFQARLRVGGVDAATNYTYYQFSGSGSGTNTANNAAQTTFQMDAVSGTGPKAGTLNLFDPQVAANTTGLLTTSFNTSTAGVGLQGGSHTTTASYDGISFIASAGTFSAGQVNIYGLKD